MSFTGWAARRWPLWAWSLLFKISPWHRGYERGRVDGIAAGRIMERQDW